MSMFAEHLSLIKQSQQITKQKLLKKKTVLRNDIEKQII